MRDVYKKAEESKKSEIEERVMKRLPSGKKWERTKSFQEKYRCAGHQSPACVMRSPPICTAVIFFLKVQLPLATGLRLI